MSRLWIDTSVLIQAKNGLYAFDVNPGFWDSLDRESGQGTVATSVMVLDELVHPDPEKRDELGQWAAKRKNGAFFVEPDASVQSLASTVINHVFISKNRAEAEEFLSGADPWLIAHALHDGGTVVTEEKLVGIGSRKIKIPNICQEFKVPYLRTADMLRTLRVSFSLPEK